MEILAIPDVTDVRKEDSNDVFVKLLEQEENGRLLGDAVCELIEIQELSNSKVQIDFGEIDDISPEAAWGLLSVLLDKYSIFELNKKCEWVNKKQSVTNTLRSSAKRYCSLVYDSYWR